MKKLFIASCTLLMFGAVAQAQSLDADTKVASKKIEAKAVVIEKASTDADYNAADAEAANKKAVLINKPLTADQKVAAKAEYEMKLKKDVKSKKAASKIDN